MKSLPIGYSLKNFKKVNNEKKSSKRNTNFGKSPSNSKVDFMTQTISSNSRRRFLTLSKNMIADESKKDVNQQSQNQMQG